MPGVTELARLRHYCDNTHYYSTLSGVATWLAWISFTTRKLRLFRNRCFVKILFSNLIKTTQHFRNSNFQFSTHSSFSISIWDSHHETERKNVYFCCIFIILLLNSHWMKCLWLNHLKMHEHSLNGNYSNARIKHVYILFNLNDSINSL